MLAALERADAQGLTVYELGGPGGPTTYTMREIMELVVTHTGRRRALVPVPFPVARLQAGVLELLPNPPLTRDQVEMLKSDNVVDPDLPGLADLGIEPTACEVVLPTYLDRFRPGGRYNPRRTRAE